MDPQPSLENLRVGQNFMSALLTYSPDYVKLYNLIFTPARNQGCLQPPGSDSPSHGLALWRMQARPSDRRRAWLP